MGDFNDGISIDELSEIYRVEKKSRGLSTVRPDLFTAMARLQKETRKTYEELLRANPDDLACEGANTRRKRCQQLARDIIDMRMRKICQMALRGAIGGMNNLDSLTSEEKDYYESVLALSKNHCSLLDRINGNIRYTNKDITETPKPVVKEEFIPIPQPEEQVEEYYEPEDEIPIPTEEPEMEIPVPVKVVETSEPKEEFTEIPMDLVPEAGDFELEEEPEMEIPDDELDKMVPQDKPAEKVRVDDPDFMLLRILTDIPPFSGPTRNYELKAEQIVRMPTEIAQALVNRNFAVKVDYSP